MSDPGSWFSVTLFDETDKVDISCIAIIKNNNNNFWISGVLLQSAAEL